MSSVFDKLLTEGLLNSPPRFLKNNICMEVITGSVAYGTNLDNKSDFDVCGIAIPEKNMIFPHLAGEIFGFGKQIKRFEQFQQHHINYKNQKEYDITIFSIIKYFQLAMDNNPNIIDILYTPQECILHINTIGQMIRDNRKLFLHKGAYHKFRGYAFAQQAKMSSNKRTGKRKEIYDLYNFDCKFAMHLCRLLQECEQILTFGDLDLRKGNEYLKAIRRGDVSETDIRLWASEKEKYLDKLYHDSKLQHSPDEAAIKQLLMNCLEHHFGSLSNVIVNPDRYEVALKSINQIMADLNL